jgi:peptidoglycan/LPS O-acetylase OafA/YrhL
MDILDWAYMGAHFLWIFGLSLIVAVFSYHRWRALEMQRPTSAIFGERSWNVADNIGLALMPLAITVMPRSERWFVRLFALIISAGFALQAVRASLMSAQPKHRADGAQKNPRVKHQ